MAEGGEVVLHLYDLSHGLAAQLSLSLIGRHVEAVYHTGVVVFGREVYFGGGIQQAPPGRTQYGTPMRRLALGRTLLTEDALRDFLGGLSASTFAADKYHILENNCNNFSETLCAFLLGREGCVPQEVLDLPRIVMQSPLAGAIAPMLQPISAALSVAETQPQQPQQQQQPQQHPPPQADDRDSEAAFEAAVRAEFEALLAAAPNTDTDEAAALAVSRVLSRQGLT
jgi:hypothetical protein